MYKLSLFLFVLFQSNLIYADAIKIAIIDSGIDKNAIKSTSLVLDQRFNCPFTINTDTDTVCEKQDQEFILNKEYHGTLVAQIITNKNPNVKVADFIYADINKSLFQLYQTRFPENGRQVWERTQLYKRIESNLINAINHASNLGSKIINISSGDSFFKSELLFNKIKENKDILFVVASGNNGKELLLHNKYYPCSFNLPNLICVGAVTSKYKISDYSNFGDDVSIYVKEDPKNQGTSFVAPKVTRLASIMANNDKTLTAFDLKRIILKKTKDINNLKILDDSILTK